MNCLKVFGTKDLKGSGILCKREEERQRAGMLMQLYSGKNTHTHIYIDLLRVSLKGYKVAKERRASFVTDLYETKLRVMSRLCIDIC